MIPFVVSLFNQQFGDGAPPPAGFDIPVTLLLSSDAGTSAYSNTFDPGPEYGSRVFVISWVLYRNNSTGTATLNSATLDGVALRAESQAGSSRGILYWAIVYAPTGTSLRTLAFSVTNGGVDNIRVVRLGSATAKVKLRDQFQAGVASTAGITSGTISLPTTDKLVLVTNRSNDSGEQIDQVGSVLVNGGTFSSDGGVNNYSRLVTLQPSAALTEITQPVSAATERKTMIGAVLSHKEADELTFLPRTDLLYYHMMAHKEVYKDGSSTPCADGDTVQVWGNSGSSVDMQQATAARRPTYRTGGANGYPYLSCDRTTQQYFEDLTDIPQNGGSTTASPYTLAGVLELTDLATMQPLLGDTNTRGRFFITTAGAISLYKTAFVYLTGAFTSGTLIAFCANISEWQNVAGTVNNVEGSQRQVDAASGTVTNNVQVLRSTNGAAFFHGKLYELMYWRVALSTNDRQRVVLSLMEKYGLAI